MVWINQGVQSFMVTEETVMADKNRDFATLLNELLAADREASWGRKPSVHLDCLAAAEALERITVSDDVAVAEYRETSGLAAELDALFDAAGAATEATLSTDPADITRELGLGVRRQAVELARIRRAFAFKNHPDRVPAHLRERALQRMKLANMLIDEARRTALA